MDHYFLKNHGCVFPPLTNNPNQNLCIIDISHRVTFQSVSIKYFHDFCPMPCEKMKVNFAGHDSIDHNGIENEAYVKFYIKDQIQVKKSRLSYSEVTLLAEVGGYVGLLLGVSLMDIASLFDKACIIINQKLSS